MTRTRIRTLIAALITCGFSFAQSVSISDQPVPVKGRDQQAKLVKRVPPKYPAEAKAAGIEGLVRLEVLIGKEGTVKDIKVLAGPEELRPPTLEAIRQWQWKPTTVNGQAVEVITQIDVNFELSRGKDKSKS
jgi:protein TonB